MRCARCGEELDEAYQITHGYVDDAEFVSDVVDSKYRCPKCMHRAPRRQPRIMALQDWIDYEQERLLEKVG